MLNSALRGQPVSPTDLHGQAPFKGLSQSVRTSPRLLAERFLQARGHRILPRNLRTSLSALDLVAEDRRVLVFVEVKTRATDVLGRTVLAVNRRKQAKLVPLASQYSAQHHWADRSCRFDVVLVQGHSASQGRVQHLQNAFDAGA
ncbi:MAG: YraN family protein [Nitrospira sp.]|nr:YraN family protein [Nitrospira sp.]